MIKSVNIQKNGIFGYFLHNENTRKGDLFTGDRSGLSCIVRIQRDHEFIKVYFESSLVFMNDTKFDLYILAVEHTHPRQKQESLVLKSLAEFNAPLTWFTNQASICKLIMQNLSFYLIIPLIFAVSILPMRVLYAISSYFIYRKLK